MSWLINMNKFKSAVEITRQIFNDYNDFYLVEMESWVEIFINYSMYATRSNRN